MRNLLLSLLIVLPALSVFAEDVNAIMLHLASGKTVTCMMDENPVVTFSGEDFAIKTQESTITYSGTDVLKFTYTYVEPSSIKSIMTERTLFSLNGYILNASSLEPSSCVTVFTVDGKKVTEAKTTSNGCATLSLPSQPGVTYIINTSVTNFKITVP